MIPEHLIHIHERRCKRKSSQKLDDNAFYEIERMYLKPLFYRNQEAMRIAKDWSSSKSKSSLKRKLRVYVASLFELFELNIDGLKVCQLKYTKAKARGIKSTWDYDKRTMFLNEHSIENAVGETKGSLSLLYTTLHELAHGLCEHYYSGRGHNHLFFETLMKVLNKVTRNGMNKAYIRRVEVDYNDYATLDEYARRAGIFSRGLSKHYSIIEAESLSRALSVFNSRYSERIIAPESRVIVDGKKVAENRFDYESRPIEHFHHRSLGSIFAKYKFKAVRTKNGVKLCVVQDERLMRHLGREYVKHLEYIHQNLKK